MPTHDDICEIKNKVLVQSNNMQNKIRILRTIEDCVDNMPLNKRKADGNDAWSAVWPLERVHTGKGQYLCVAGLGVAFVFLHSLSICVFYNECILPGTNESILWIRQNRFYVLFGSHEPLSVNSVEWWDNSMTLKKLGNLVGWQFADKGIG